MEINDLIKSLEGIQQKIIRLEESFQNIKKTSITVQIDVKDLHLTELNLDELAFHLDKLNIHDLSGVLNLGNNFSSKMHNKKKTNSTPARNTGGREGNERTKGKIEIIINGKSLPYTWKVG